MEFLSELFCVWRDQKNETWRYVTYSLVHKDVEHITANLVLLLCLGLVLEMVHGCWRVGLVFFSGILAGSLSAYCFDREYGLIGCSGGVYSITLAHISTLVLNWKEDTSLIITRYDSQLLLTSSKQYSASEPGRTEILFTQSTGKD